MHITGSARDFLSAPRSLEATATSPPRHDSLVLGISLVPADIDRGWGRRLGEIETVLESQLRVNAPRILVLVLEDQTQAPEHDLVEASRHLVDSASVYARNRLGRDLTAIAIVTSTADRSLTAERIAEHLSRQIDIGDGTILTPGDLERRTIRDLLIEAVV